MESNTGTKAGTVGGTLLTFFYNLHLEDLAKTAILAAIGAIVSFCVSIGLKAIVKHFRK
jgi:hypothetical protein